MGTLRDVVVGVDIGQKRDPTAICVVELEERTAPREPHERLTCNGVYYHEPKEEMHYLVRHLERMPLGTPYPAVARRIGQICAEVGKRVESPEVFVDATGVGKPIVDLLYENARMACRITAVYFTHGDRRVKNWVDGRYEMRLGKAYLVSRLQALLQCHRLHLPKTSESQALAQELLDYEIRVDENANDRYGAFRVGTHDDLVTALGLAAQLERCFFSYFDM